MSTSARPRLPDLLGGGLGTADAHGAGKPDFIVCTDPDGWAGDYPVAYWDAAWKAVVFGGADSLLQQVLAAGFDGIYMDWVGGFQQEEVVTRAGEDGVDPADEMIRFIRQLRQRARAADPEFLVIPQNAPDLVADHPEYLGVIDAVGQEDVHFSGGADAAWGGRARGCANTRRDEVGAPVARAPGSVPGRQNCSPSTTACSASAAEAYRLASTRYVRS